MSVRKTLLKKVHPTHEQVVTLEDFPHSWLTNESPTARLLDKYVLVRTSTVNNPQLVGSLETFPHSMGPETSDIISNEKANQILWIEDSC